MEMIYHIRILATICGAFVVVTGSWLAMRERWRWAWSANTAGLSLLVLLALSPLPTGPDSVLPIASPAIPGTGHYVAAWQEAYYHVPDCPWARQSIRDDNRVDLLCAEAAARSHFIPCPRCLGTRLVATGSKSGAK